MFLAQIGSTTFSIWHPVLTLYARIMTEARRDPLGVIERREHALET